MKSSLKERAKSLRAQGWSYADIASELGVGKSTLSQWLKNVPYAANDTVVKRISLARARSAEYKISRRIASIKSAEASASQELGDLNKRDLLMLGLGFYLGEGSKSYEDIRIVNSDPQAVSLAVNWFIKCCHVPLENLKATIHAYPDTDLRQATLFWSAKTGIAATSFMKPQIDRRSGKSLRKRWMLPFGTIHIRIKAGGDAQLGVALHRRIMGWMKHVLEKSAGVV